MNLFAFLCFFCSTSLFLQVDATGQMVESFHVMSDIRYRFATTQMSSVIKNVASEARQVTFDVTLPKEAFIMGFNMEIDGQRYDGDVMERKAAKERYQQAVDQGQSAGHVRQAPRHANIFQVAVNVAADNSVNFTLTYQELLRRRFGIYEHEIHIRPGQPVKDFTIQVQLLENRPLRFVRTPALRTDDLLTNEISEEHDLTVVELRTPETAVVLYEPSLIEQGEGLDARFVLQYDVEQAAPGGDILVVDGYFVHFLSPDRVTAPLPKDIMFVLDVSGSMSGNKIAQVKVAMETILTDMQPYDRLNIITFNSNIFKWQEIMVRADADNIDKAKKYVDDMIAGGGTNINEALQSALEELRSRTDKERVGMIFFLTDGLPSAGETVFTIINSNIARINEGVVAIFSLAFGDGADYESLKQLSAQNNGFARKIYEASDADLQVATLYNEISAVVIKDMSITYQDSSVDEFSLTQTDFPIVFNGTDIIVCGLLNSETTTIEYEISGLEESGPTVITMEVDTTDTSVVIQDTSNALFSGPRDYASLLERMWAYLTIKQLLIKLDQYADNEEKVNATKDQVLTMSLKYGLVTPLTSMVVTLPEGKQTDVGEKDSDNMEHREFASSYPGLASNPGLAADPDIKHKSFDPGNGHVRLFYNNILVFILPWPIYILPSLSTGKVLI